MAKGILHRPPGSWCIPSRPHGSAKGTSTGCLSRRSDLGRPRVTNSPGCATERPFSPRSGCPARWGFVRLCHCGTVCSVRDDCPAVSPQRLSGCVTGMLLTTRWHQDCAVDPYPPVPLSWPPVPCPAARSCHSSGAVRELAPAPKPGGPATILSLPAGRPRPGTLMSRMFSGCLCLASPSGPPTRRSPGWGAVGHPLPQQPQHRQDGDRREGGTRRVTPKLPVIVMATKVSQGCVTRLPW